MRFLFGTPCLFLFGLCLPAQPVSRDTPSPGKRIVIAVDTALDGKGGALRKTRIVIEGSKIVAIDPKAKPIDYDLRGLTVLPGWIDAHVHITSIFGKDGKSAGGDGTTQVDAFRHRPAASPYVTPLRTDRSLDHEFSLRSKRWWDAAQLVSGLSTRK